MEIESLGVILMGVGVAIFTYTNLKRHLIQRKAAKDIKHEFQTNPSLEDVHKKNESILRNVEVFLRGSCFYEIHGKKGGENIYRYVLNDGKLYEFDTFQSPESLKIGQDEDFLCFKGMSYKRSTDTKDFSKKYLKSEVEMKLSVSA